MSPTTSARRSSISASSAAMLASAASSSTRTTAPAKRRPSPRLWAFRFSRRFPADEDIRRKSANYEIIGRPGERWASLFENLAADVAEAMPNHPKPLTPGRIAWPVQRRSGRTRRRARSRLDGRHVRRGPCRKAFARSRLRRAVRSAMTLELPPKPRRPIEAPARPPKRPPASARRAGRGRTRLPRRPLKPCSKPPEGRRRAKRSRATPRTIRPARTINRKACARPSDRCASACACAAPPPCFRARPAASTA